MRRCTSSCPPQSVPPRFADDLSELVALARAQDQGITIRAAGTSLAGQNTGSGIVADISRQMTEIMALDAAGACRDQRNRAVAAHQLLVGPSTSATNRCMMGGIIGNNASGSCSPAYGTTRDHVLAVGCAPTASSGWCWKCAPQPENGSMRRWRHERQDYSAEWRRHRGHRP